MSATRTPGLMPRRSMTRSASPAASRLSSSADEAETIEATGRSGRGKGLSGTVSGEAVRPQAAITKRTSARRRSRSLRGVGKRRSWLMRVSPREYGTGVPARPRRRALPGPGGCLILRPRAGELGGTRRDSRRRGGHVEFHIGEDQRRLQKRARDQAADFATRAAQHDREASHPLENYAALREAGFYGLNIPTALGGEGV